MKELEEQLLEDVTGSVLLALNDMTSQCDDLYTLIGDGKELSQDEYDAILSAYDLISEIHDKYDDSYDLNSEIDYGDIDLSDDEELDEDISILDEAPDVTKLSNKKLIKYLEDNWTNEKGISRAFGEQLKRASIEAKRRNLKWKMKEDLDEAISSYEGFIKQHGFSKIDSSVKLLTPFKVVEAYGLKMRAGKWADTFIGKLNHVSYKFFYQEDGDVYYYPTEKDLIKSMGHAAPMMRETWDRKGMEISKNKASLKHFEDKLEKAKKENRQDLVKDFEAIIRNLKKKLNMKEEKTVIVKHNLSLQTENAESILDKIATLTENTSIENNDGSIMFENEEDIAEACEALVNYYSALEENLEIVDLDAIVEDFDETKFRRLAITGLVDDKDTAKIIRAMKDLQAGKTLDVAKKNLIIDTFMNILGIITGDTSIFTKVQKAVKTSE